MSPREMSSKIVVLESLAEIVARLKVSGQSVIMCHGVFDLVHIGHIRHFEQARKHGDALVVTVTPDRYVNKGVHRPAFAEALRAEAVAALQVVDYVAINRWPTAAETIRLIRPTVYCKGSEYRKVQGDNQTALLGEIAAATEVGGRIEYTEDITFSSSQLINSHFMVFPPETEEWLRAFRARHSADEVLAHLESTASMRALVVGEAIIDEYLFCDGLGKSTKDPILAFQYRFTETYPGGSLAVANHLAGFCREVGLITFLGEHESREDFVRQALLPGVQPYILRRLRAPTIHKRRFVDTHTNARMFELYVMDDRPIGPEEEAEFLTILGRIVNDYDVVVVADYGHGLLTPAAIGRLCKEARFLAVNTQANAGNRGFNTISKYPRADYVCLAGHEIALETRMRHANHRDLLLEVTKRIDCPCFTVTRGRDGILHYERGQGFVEVPAVAIQIADRVGAGDAVLAVTSLLVAQRAPWDAIGLVGNIAGAEVVADLGNRVTVNRSSVARNVVSLMK